MNLPNKLTVVRIVLTPFFLAAMLLKLNYNINYLIAAVIFIAASVTDFLDGRIARHCYHLRQALRPAGG